ncbi:MAG TPA: carboxypeptidase regulatory-like domain-containing protein, partial [Nakamurella sp.]
PNGTLRVTGRDFSGAAVDRSCAFTTQNTGACVPAQANTTITGTTVAFGQLLPGGYQVAFTSTDGLYRPLTMSVQIAGGTDPVQITMNLAAGTSIQRGTVLGPDSQPVAGATVTLRQNNNVELVAKDVAGADYPAVTTGADGAFQFSTVPDGVYRVMVDACGYGRTFSAAITLNTQVTANPPAVTVRLAPVTRSVTVNLSSSAGTSLVGLPASFQPVGLQSDDPACTVAAGVTNTARSGFFVAPDGTVTAPQLPTGRWAVSVATANSPFGASTPSFLAPMPDFGTPTLTPSIPPINIIGTGGQIRQAQVTLNVSWPAGCATAPASVRLTLTPGAGDPVTLDATVRSNADKSGTATLTTLLPAGSYSWSLAADNGFTAQPATGTLTVPSSGPTPAQSIDSQLLPPAVPVTTTLSVDGAPPQPAGIVSATPAGGGPVVTSDATGLLCLAPTPGWSIAIRSTADATMLIPDITGVNVTRAGPNTVAFVGFTLQPGVTLAPVARRTPDTAARNVPLTVTGPGTTWNGTATIAAQASSGTGPTLTLGAGSYTAASAASAPFGTASQSGIDPSTTHTVTLTLPYTAVTLAVTASGAPEPGATFTLTPAAGGSPITTTTADPALFRDIAPGTYTIAATKTVGAVTYSGQLTDQQFTAGTSPQVNVPMTAPPPPPPPPGPGP